MKKLRHKEISNVYKLTSQKRQRQSENTGNLAAQVGLLKTQITLPLTLTKDLCLFTAIVSQ